LAWTGYRLRETHRQKETLLARLGQLNSEIEARERQEQLERCKRVVIFRSHMVLGDESLQMSLSSLKPLNFISPTCIYRMATFSWVAQPEQRPLDQGEYLTTQKPYGSGVSLPSPRKCDDSIEPSANLEFRRSAIASRAVYRFPLPLRSASVPTIDLGTRMDSSSIPTRKRHSLPDGPGNIKIWSDTRTDEDEIEDGEAEEGSTQYQGYFVKSNRTQMNTDA